MSRRELREQGGYRLVANAAQLSIRDLRLRPLRPLPQAQLKVDRESVLEQALLDYLDSLPDEYGR